MKRLTATTALCVLFCTAFAAGKGPAATVPGGYPDSLRSVWLYTEGIKQNTIFHDTVRAREYLTEAIRADSTYAPAYYEMATNGMYSTPDEAVELARSGRSFVKGLLTNLANPKAIIYFGSVFSLFVGDSVGAGARWGIFLLIIVETLAWFMVVASLFALPGMRRGYQRMAKWIDGIAGTLFAGFGIHLIISR